MVEVEKGLYRVTFSLPLGIDHVHCYFVRSSNGGFILVDTGLGSREPEAKWRPILAELDAPIEAIVVTHMHPDHVGGARDVAELTGAPVYQGRIDHAQCALAWGERDPQRFAEYWTSHGMPRSTVAGIVGESERLLAAVHWVETPDRLLEPGDEVDGWRVEVLPGHADGHIVLERDGVVIAGDTILMGITPTIGLYPNSRPDPLGDYLETLRWYEERAPRVAYTGHREAVADPAGRAAEIAAHHAHRLDLAEAALDGTPLSAYDVSLALFEEDLSTTLRRFATAEALAHLERLVLDGRAARAGTAYVRPGDTMEA
ncbi:MAG TPA: MBL fold metallo-hydrolase [Gaiellaceae bacterium]|nr:MBL fold metallo-hydrolase [Gaiellaceae bacterium]